MATDDFEMTSRNVFAPSLSADPVTPDDATELSRLPRAIYAGGAGDIVVRLADDSTDVTFTVAAGAILPIRPKLVKATGTTATSIVALY